MQDKSKELNTSVELVNDKLNFSGYVEGNEPVSIDYTPPLGDNLGYTSLELLLLSLSTCLGSAVLTFLRKMNKTIEGCQVTATGLRRDEHPTGFHTINLVIRLNSPNVHETDMIRVIKLAEDTYCPVWAMLKGNVLINTTFVLIR